MGKDRNSNIHRFLSVIKGTAANYQFRSIYLKRAWLLMLLQY